MRAVFADSSYHVALFNAADVHPTAALRLARKLRCRVIVTEYVLLELGSALSRRRDRPLPSPLLTERLQQAASLEYV